MGENGVRLDLANAPAKARETSWPRAGDVFRKAGGRSPGFWVVVAVRGEQAFVLSYDLDGECDGTQSYRASYFSENYARKVGVTYNLPNTISVSWEPAP